MNEKAIVVLAYNRPRALSNLLSSLTKIKCDNNVPLIISIDNQGTKEVNSIAKEYKWAFGEKRVIIHEERLGLKSHFIFSGDLTCEFPNIIFLEDDLLVSPSILEFCDAYLDAYSKDDRIAGASLYNPVLKEGTGCKYYQIEDGADVYFLQQPYWGNIWSHNKWNYFKKWLVAYKPNLEILPNYIAAWKDTSFKKVYIQYLIETNRFFVTPRISLLTNTGEIGLHNIISKYQYQCNIQVGERTFRMISFDDSLSIYDAYFEIIPEVLKKINPELAKYDFYVDIYAQKRKDKTIDYCITSRDVSKALKTYCCDMKPKELSVLLDIRGTGISLCRNDDIQYASLNRSKILANDILDNYTVDFKAALFVLFRKIKEKVERFKV